MKISDAAWKNQQKFELDFILKYQWKEDWEKLYRQYLKDFFGINGIFLNKVVVDVGCGPIGIISVVEAEKKIGLDPLMDDYKKRFKTDSDIEYFAACGENIPLPNDYADIVFCINVLNHVQDPEKVLKETARILKPTGKLYFDTHNNPLSVGHPHIFTKNQIFSMLRKYFKIEKTTEWNRIPSISYDVYCANCQRKLLLRQQHQVCPHCGEKNKKLKKRIFISKTKVWGAICSNPKMT